MSIINTFTQGAPFALFQIFLTIHLIHEFFEFHDIGFFTQTCVLNEQKNRPGRQKLEEGKKLMMIKAVKYCRVCSRMSANCQVMRCEGFPTFACSLFRSRFCLAFSSGFKVFRLRVGFPSAPTTISSSPQLLPPKATSAAAASRSCFSG